MQRGRFFPPLAQWNAVMTISVACKDCQAMGEEEEEEDVVVVVVVLAFCDDVVGCSDALQ